MVGVLIQVAATTTAKRATVIATEVEVQQHQKVLVS
jgi:hypothetical protein